MKNRRLLIKVAWLAALVILIVSGFLGLYFFWKNNYQGKFSPGLTLNGYPLSQLSLSEATTLITNQLEVLDENGLDFTYNGRLIKVAITSASFDPDLSSRWLIFSPDTDLREIFENSKPNSFFHFLASYLTPAKQKTFFLNYNLTEEVLFKIIDQSFPEANTAPESAYFYYEDLSAELKIMPEKIGKEIDRADVLKKIANNLNSLSTQTIVIKTKSKYPQARYADLVDLQDLAKNLINQQNLNLLYKKPNANLATKIWNISPQKLITWLTIDPSSTEGKLILNKETVAKYLEASIAAEINLEAVRPRFEMKGDKVSYWQKGVNGQKLNITDSANLIALQFLAGEKDITLIIDEILSEDPETGLAYNIQEIIGTGHSNFAGSSPNRVKNIEIGAQAVNGTLLAPGEEFSLAKVLGEVSAASGYLPELVIKGNETVPEYGGGLCQVSTTLFRSALQSGLPISERRNHSYRVSYYEPAGTDAAIYIPNPDLKFVNDTDNYLLIQARIEGSDIYFDFWGKSDGREVFISDPVIYNIVAPPPSKYIETDTLSPGAKKCTESARNGADTYFDYRVTYPLVASSSPLEVRFNSHYVPWREVCLVGKELPDPDLDEPTDLDNTEEEVIEDIVD